MPRNSPTWQFASENADAPGGPIAVGVGVVAGAGVGVVVAALVSFEVELSVCSSLLVAFPDDVSLTATDPLEPAGAGGGVVVGVTGFHQLLFKMPLACHMLKTT